MGGEEPEEAEADTQPARQNDRGEGGGGHHRPWPLAPPTTTKTPRRPVFSSAPPPTAASSLVHPTPEPLGSNPHPLHLLLDLENPRLRAQLGEPRRPCTLNRRDSGVSPA
jgi:hypothetical protein